MSKYTKSQNETADVNEGEDEEVYFQDDLILITRTRAMIAGVTYAMRNVTSVRTFIEPRPLWVGLIGAFFVVCGLTSVYFGILGAALCIICALHPPKYWVRIGTAGAEANAVYSKDRDWTATVVEAINNAIISRG